MQHSSSTGGSSSGTAPENILVVVKSYTSIGEKTVNCTLERMERTTDRVVFVSCLTMVPFSDSGMWLPSGSVSDTARIEAEQVQVTGLEFCLERIRPLFRDRQVELDIQGKSGSSEESIIKALAMELRPRWIIFDSSLSRLKRKLERDLKTTSNLAFIGSSPPSIITEAWFNSPGGEITRSEVTVEDTSYRSRSVRCCNGLFTFRQVSRSTSNRALRRTEEPTSLHMRRNA